MSLRNYYDVVTEFLKNVKGPIHIYKNRLHYESSMQANFTYPIILR